MQLPPGPRANPPPRPPPPLPSVVTKAGRCLSDNWSWRSKQRRPSRRMPREASRCESSRTSRSGALGADCRVAVSPSRDRTSCTDIRKQASNVSCNSSRPSSPVGTPRARAGRARATNRVLPRPRHRCAAARALHVEALDAALVCDGFPAARADAVAARPEGEPAATATTAAHSSTGPWARAGRACSVSSGHS